MRFLLFIALALLPLSLTLKCYVGEDHYNEDGTPNSEKSVAKIARHCPRSSKVCVWVHLIPDEHKHTVYRCGKPGGEEADGDGDEALCQHQEIETSYEEKTFRIPRKICTCKTDFCNENESATGPTAFLLLAAAAAMIVA